MPVTRGPQPDAAVPVEAGGGTCNGVPGSLPALYETARDRLPARIWDYLTGGAETETTLKRNRRALDALVLRPRLPAVRAVPVSGRGSLLGTALRIPVVLAPIGGIRDVHPGGAADIARAATRFGTIAIHGCVSYPPLEAIAAAASGPRVYQLYMHEGEDWLDTHTRRAIAAGCAAVCLTVDVPVYSRRERDIARRYTNAVRLAETSADEMRQAGLGWDDVARFKERHAIPLVLKGVFCAEDACLACDHGVEVVYVSNHGGRSLDHGRGALEVLPEVVEAVGGRAEIVVDGGVLRGTDVVKAMALGANAVGIGKLMGIALAAAGEDGVVRALELLEREIGETLAALGAGSFDEVGPACLQPAGPVTPFRAVDAFAPLEKSRQADGSAAVPDGGAGAFGTTI